MVDDKLQCDDTQLQSPEMVFVLKIYVDYLTITEESVRDVRLAFDVKSGTPSRL